MIPATPGDIGWFTIPDGARSGDIVIHDKENSRAWVQSDTTVAEVVEFAAGEIEEADAGSDE